MSASAEALLEQLKKLSPGEKEEILHELLRDTPDSRQPKSRAFPKVKVAGGVITSEHVAEVLADE